ncbi:DUF2059 domain-containing protein [Rhodanobacter sp. AS-Z3]|uniref:DUF2059 domain-containing protein n=1 Tax=Rhodanobacter sp. AS-Z3 TaxID=3031330 RepID=UPI0024797802|nr:DUF2059 domain-containing protein [Rhodanobacter sp. AS-Z3]WEN14318.1 DUF2059 domain-containing protein [Rhodanobacter sp. AS-Z3]
MHKWTGFAVATVLAFAAAGQAHAAQPSEKQVHELFDVMHMDGMFTQMNTQMAGMMGQALPCVPTSYWQDFMDASSRQQLLGQMVPIYQRHFTAQDVDGLLKFYRSPLGQKVITQMPVTMAEGMKVGQDWGRARAQAMIEKLRQKGTLEANGRCPASPAAMPAAVPAPKSGR